MCACLCAQQNEGCSPMAGWTEDMGLATAPQLPRYPLQHQRHQALSQKYEITSALLQ